MLFCLIQMQDKGVFDLVLLHQIVTQKSLSLSADA